MKAKREIVHGQKRFVDMTETEARELAILIDTKGVLYADPQYYKNLSYYHPEIAVQMSNQVKLQELAVEWGGCLSKGEWRINKHAEVRALLEKVRPFLQIRQRQAVVALEMLDVLEAKDEGWDDELKVLAARMRNAH